MENLVLYDWVSITSKIHTPEQIIALLGMESVTWDSIRGAHGYKDRLYFNCISIHYNGSPDMGVWLEMSGQGCRAFETIGHADYDFLFQLVQNNPDQMRITRLDVAFDDHTGILDIGTITADTLCGNYVSKATSWECIQSSKGTSVVIGSRQSPVLIRIYDKAAERGYKSEEVRRRETPLSSDKNVPPQRAPQGAQSPFPPAGEESMHWIRIELQMRDDRCLEFVNQPYDVGHTFAGVLLNYLRYVEPDESDSNKWRWPLTDYWSEVIGETCRIKLYTKPGITYNLLNCENFVFGQAGNAINALLKVYDVDTFLQKLQQRNVRPNPKYTQMVNNYLAGDILNERSKKQ